MVSLTTTTSTLSLWRTRRWWWTAPPCLGRSPASHVVRVMLILSIITIFLAGTINCTYSTFSLSPTYQYYSQVQYMIQYSTVQYSITTQDCTTPSQDSCYLQSLPSGNLIQLQHSNRSITKLALPRYTPYTVHRAGGMRRLITFFIFNVLYHSKNEF